MLVDRQPLAGVSDETDPDLEQVKDLTLASYLSFVFCIRVEKKMVAAVSD
jgi:hypothetical protein